MNIALISAGSNIDPAENVRKAMALLAQKFRHISVSKSRRTKPIGFADQPDFINAVSCIRTKKSKAELKLLLKEIEDRLGRVRTGNKFGPRTIDLDIVVWNGDVIDDDVYTRDFLREMIVEVQPDMKDKITLNQPPQSRPHPK
jgi:2-amino-4-hydroxy-6-hydroxymethyldihydropteridine diphosphokinase